MKRMITAVALGGLLALSGPALAQNGGDLAAGAATGAVGGAIVGGPVGAAAGAAVGAAAGAIAGAASEPKATGTIIVEEPAPAVRERTCVEDAAGNETCREVVR
jgi:hypothetical protein